MAKPRTVRADANALNSEEIAALLSERFPLALNGPNNWTTRPGHVGHSDSKVA
jgi:hypothetical protein